MRGVLLSALFWSLIALSVGAQVRLGPGGKLSLSNGGRLRLVARVVEEPLVLVDGDVTATMTSSTTPSPHAVSAQSIYSATYAAWKAFDGNQGTFWSAANGDPTAWLKYDFGAKYSNPIVKIRVLIGGSGYELRALKTFSFQGSDDDVSYTTIYSGGMAQAAGWQEFTFSNSNTYRFYRFTNVTVYSAQPALFEVEFYEKGD